MTRYRRKAMALTGLLVVALAVAYVARSAGHTPPYDANLVRLAETELEGYCGGVAFWMSGGYGDKNKAATCRSEQKEKKASKPDLLRVQPAFCQAVVDQGWEGTLPECLQILDSQKLWPTYDGGLSNAWNRARPYPRPVIETRTKAPQDTSRTGGHQGQQRSQYPTR